MNPLLRFLLMFSLVTKPLWYRVLRQLWKTWGIKLTSLALDLGMLLGQERKAESQWILKDELVKKGTQQISPSHFGCLQLAETSWVGRPQDDGGKKGTSLLENVRWTAWKTPMKTKVLNRWAHIHIYILYIYIYLYIYVEIMYICRTE